MAKNVAFLQKRIITRNMSNVVAALTAYGEAAVLSEVCGARAELTSTMMSVSCPLAASKSHRSDIMGVLVDSMARPKT